MWDEGGLLQGPGGFVQLLELSCISSPIPRHYPQSHASLFIPHCSHHLLLALLPALTTLKGHCFCVCSPNSTVGISAEGAVSFIRPCAYPSMVGTQYCRRIPYWNGWQREKSKGTGSLIPLEIIDHLLTSLS